VTDKKKEQEEEEEEEEEEVEEEEQEEEEEEGQVAIFEVHNPVKSRICFEVNKLSLETHCSIILLFNCRIISAAAAVTPSAGQQLQPQQNNSNQAQWSGFEI
jgi:CO dehydrogenase/acetyl-CoA synthase beta subunit